MQLYISDDKQVVLKSDSTDIHTIVDDVLPPVLKGNRVKREDLEEFFYRLHIALAPPGLFDGVSSATKAKPANVTIPPINEGHYFLVEKGVFQHERLRDLVRAIAMRWHKPPPPGFVWNIITRPDDYGQLEPILERLDIPEPQSELLDFINIMTPPEYQNGTAMTSDDADEMVQTIMRWVLREPPVTAKEADKAIMKRDLMDLGLRGITGELDKRRAKLAAQYIWSADAGEPNYAKLKTWLNAQDSKDMKTAKTKTKAAQKKKKIQRKQRKLGRKRR